MSIQSPATPTLPIAEYASLRELALNTLNATHHTDGLPEFFAPRPMSGSMTFHTA